MKAQEKKEAQAKRAAEKAAEKAEKAAREKAMGTDKKKPAPINLSLHGPRVDIVLAWLGGVHLPELESVATT